VCLGFFFFKVFRSPQEWLAPTMPWFSKGDRRADIKRARQGWRRQLGYEQEVLTQARRLARSKGERSFSIDTKDGATLFVEVPPWKLVPGGFMGFCLNGGALPEVIVSHRLGKNHFSPSDLVAQINYFGSSLVWTAGSDAEDSKSGVMDTSAHDRLIAWMKGKPDHGPDVVYISRPRQPNK
jgi:hypothetical protein